MTYVKTERHGAVLEITMARPPVNALNHEMNTELYEAFRTLRDEPDLMVAIITGEGKKAFSAGWDLKQIASGEEGAQGDDLDMGPGGFGGLTTLWDLNKPVIAALNSHAVGGGFEIAMACDIVVAADHVELWLPEMQLGFIPDGGGVQRLPRQIPYNVAVDLLLTGRRMSAHEAKQWGFIRDVVPIGELMNKAREIAAGIAEGAPLTVRALKEVLNNTMHLSVEEAFVKILKGWTGECGMPIFEKMMRSEDYMEGSRAFAEKRKPVWKGK